MGLPLPPVTSRTMPAKPLPPPTPACPEGKDCPRDNYQAAQAGADKKPAFDYSRSLAYVLLGGSAALFIGRLLGKKFRAARAHAEAARARTEAAKAGTEAVKLASTGEMQTATKAFDASLKYYEQLPELFYEQLPELFPEEKHMEILEAEHAMIGDFVTSLTRALYLDSEDKLFEDIQKSLIKARFAAAQTSQYIYDLGMQSHHKGELVSQAVATDFQNGMRVIEDLEALGNELRLNGRAWGKTPDERHERAAEAFDHAAKTAERMQTGLMAVGERKGTRLLDVAIRNYESAGRELLAAEAAGLQEDPGAQLKAPELFEHAIKLRLQKKSPSNEERKETISVILDFISRLPRDKELNRARYLLQAGDQAEALGLQETEVDALGGGATWSDKAIDYLSEGGMTLVQAGDASGLDAIHRARRIIELHDAAGHNAIHDHDIGELIAMEARAITIAKTQADSLLRESNRQAAEPLYKTIVDILSARNEMPVDFDPAILPDSLEKLASIAEKFDEAQEAALERARAEKERQRLGIREPQAAEAQPAAPAATAPAAAVELEPHPAAAAVEIGAVPETPQATVELSEQPTRVGPLYALVNECIRGDRQAMLDLRRELRVDSEAELQRELRRTFEAEDVERTVDAFQRHDIFRKAGEREDVRRRERRGGIQ